MTQPAENNASKRILPSIKLKPGASIRGIKPEIALVFALICRVFDRLDQGYDTIITSGTDSAHGKSSLHFVGYALDLRTRHIKDEITRNRTPQETTKQTQKIITMTLNRLVEKLKFALGADFDVVLESDHVHIEFQPKAGLNL